MCQPGFEVTDYVNVSVYEINSQNDFFVINYFLLVYNVMIK